MHVVHLLENLLATHHFGKKKLYLHFLSVFKLGLFSFFNFWNKSIFCVLLNSMWMSFSSFFSFVVCLSQGLSHYVVLAGAHYVSHIGLKLIQIYLLDFLRAGSKSLHLSTLACCLLVLSLFSSCLGSHVVENLRMQLLTSPGVIISQQTPGFPGS